MLTGHTNVEVKADPAARWHSGARADEAEEAVDADSPEPVSDNPLADEDETQTYLVADEPAEVTGGPCSSGCDGRSRPRASSRTRTTGGRAPGDDRGGRSRAWPGG